MRLLKFSFVLLFAAFSSTVLGQKKEANPNIDTEWRFVRTQELTMSSGSFYSFEFPAEKGYDYIFNLDHKQKKLYAAISVFDLQDKPIEKKIANESNDATDLFFSVTDAGTYKVVVGITNPKGKKGEVVPAQFSLIRRIQF